MDIIGQHYSNGAGMSAITGNGTSSYSLEGRTARRKEGQDAHDREEDLATWTGRRRKRRKLSILMKDEVDDFPDTKAIYDDFVDRCERESEREREREREAERMRKRDQTLSCCACTMY